MKQNNPKICFVGLRSLPVLAPEYSQHGNGGEEVQHTLLAKAMNRQGYDVSMIVEDYGQQDGQAWDDIVTYKTYKQSEGIPVIRFVYPRWTKLWSALKRADADVYYVSCAGALLGQVALFCQYYARKVVFRIALDSDCEPDNLPVQYARDKHLYRLGLAKTHAILAQTQHQHVRMLKNFGHESRIATMLVDRPVDFRNYHDRDIDVLWVSNIRHIKRPDLVLDLAEQMPERHFHVVGGPVDQELYKQISARAATMSNVTFYGRVPYCEVGSLYDRCKVFVNTSDLEGFPNTYLQAWIRGTPVVAAFDPDGIIEREKLGRGVKDLGAMRQILSTYLEDPQKWQEVSQRCLDYMEREYNEKKLLEPYINTFHEVCKKKPGELALGMPKEEIK